MLQQHFMCEHYHNLFCHKMELTFSSEMDYFLLFQQSSSSTWPVPSSHFLLVVLKRNILLLIGPANWHYRHKLNQGFSFPIFINGKAKCWTLSLQQQDTDSALVVNHATPPSGRETLNISLIRLDNQFEILKWRLDTVFINLVSTVQCQSHVTIISETSGNIICFI